MNLLFLRHGQAEDQSTSGADDDRQLTGEGRAQLVEMRRYLWSIFPVPVKVLTSPALRTRQTAGIVIEELDCSVEIVEQLRSESEPADFAEYLESVAENTVLAVSHQPFLGRSIGYFTSGRDQSVASFPRAAICLIEYEPQSGRGRLKSLVRPEQICALASLSKPS